MQNTYFCVKNLNKFFLKTYVRVIAGFYFLYVRKNLCYFHKTFLLAEINIEVGFDFFGISIMLISNLARKNRLGEFALLRKPF